MVDNVAVGQARPTWVIAYDEAVRGEALNLAPLGVPGHLPFVFEVTDMGGLDQDKRDSSAPIESKGDVDAIGRANVLHLRIQGAGIMRRMRMVFIGRRSEGGAPADSGW